jgi:acetylornithine deacetylase/succinyl-diaminopimelate desuccinylase-like protein/MFS family permease
VTPRALGNARASVASTFVIHALVSGSWAPRIPAIKADLSLDNAELGIAFTGLAVGLFLGTRVAGRLVDRLGARQPIRVGLPVMCAALVGPALATDLFSLTAAFVFLGLVSGFLDVAMNANAVAVERGYRRPIMSGLHGFWSGGLLVGSAIGAGAAAAGIGVALHFAVVAAVLAAVTIPATRGLLSAEAKVSTAASGQVLAAKAVWAPVLLLGLIAFGSFAGEGSAADWSAVYMHETIGTGSGLAGVAFVAFSFGMITARFSGDLLSARFGPASVVRGGALLAASGLALALAAPHPASAIAGYLIFGLGLAPIVPITFSAAGNVDPARAGILLGSVVTIGYVGAVIGPAVIGFTADALSLRAALVFPVLLVLGAAALAFSVGAAAGGEPEPGTHEDAVGHGDEERRYDPNRSMVKRAVERLDVLYSLGNGAGANRPGGSEAEQNACELAAGWMEEAGLEVEWDPAGNVVGRSFGSRPELPEIWTGSHLDSVPAGGKFDGALGVVTGLEAVAGAGSSARTLGVVVFRDEERGCFGSRALVERGPLPGRYVEVHVEQGPVLERAGAALGVVSGIVGYTHREVVFEGTAGHAGTTPMAARDDALSKAAEFVLRVRDAAAGIEDAVATVGFVEVDPGAPNVVPGRVRLTVDARAPDTERLDRLLVAIGLDPEPRNEPVVMHESVRSVLREEIERLGLPAPELPSGAGHDAGVLAAAGVETGMLFVRSLNGGASHSPDELTSEEDVAVAIEVLAAALRRLAA